MMTLALLCALIQETEAKPVQEGVDLKARDAVTEALRKSGAYGGMKVEGAVGMVRPEGEEGGEERRGDRGGRGFGGGFEGMFTALVNGKGDAKISFESEEMAIDVYKVGESVVHRAVGRGTTPRPVGNFPREASEILNFAKMVEQLAGATSVSTGGEERVGEKNCTVFNCTIKPPAPEAEPAPEGGEEQDPRRMFRNMRNMDRMIRQVRAKVWVDEAGVVRKISAELERGPSDEMLEQMRAMREQFEGRRGEGEEPAPPEGEERRGRRGGRGFQIPDRFPATAYEIEIIEYLEKAEIEVPEDLKKFIEQ